MTLTGLATALEPVSRVLPPSHEASADHRSLGEGGSDAASPVVLRAATAADAAAIHALIVEHLAEGHLLPREREEIVAHASRFVVATRGDDVVACAELAPLSRTVSEVRSLVVRGEARSVGLGSEIIGELVHQATAAGFDKLCAFTHAPAYFVHLGFSIVPHVWLPEKITTDCHSCSHFRQCGQYAVVRALGREKWGRTSFFAGVREK